MATSVTVPYTGYTSSDQPATVTTTPAPTVPAPVPTSAPVVSSNTASDYVNNTIVPAMNTANATITAAQQAKNAAQSGMSTANYAPTTPASGTPGTLGYVPPYSSSTPTSITPPTPSDQAATDLANTPDAGHQWVYNSQTGDRTQIPVGSQIPAGYTTTNMKTAPALATAELPSGTSIKQYQDGTYGRFDVNGNYIGVSSQQEFTNAQNGQSILDNLNKAAQGNFPLSANQQAQIDDLKRQYSDLITKQTTANANFTGGTTVAQNMYGIGNTMMGLGAIKGVVDEGINKIAALQSEMAGAVAKMTDAFNTDNENALKDAYTAFSNSSKALQDNIDKMRTEAQAEADKVRTAEATANNAADDDIRALMAEGAKVPGGLTADQKKKLQDALDNHDAAAALTALGDSLQTAPGWMGEYLAYKKEATQAGQTPLDPIAYKNWDDNNKLPKVVDTQSDAVQEKLEQQYRQILLKPLSNRSGGLGLEDQKVNQAIHLKAVFDQYKDPKTGQYNIPKVLYNELALGLARLLSPTGQVGIELANSLTQKSAQGDLAGMMTYVTGSTVKGSSQQIFQMMKDSVDRQAHIAESNRETYMSYLRSLAPTDLSQDRQDKLESGILNNYDNPTSHPLVQDENAALQTLQDYKTAHPDQAAKMKSDIETMEKTTGKPMNATDFLQAYPEYGGGKQSFNSVGGDTNQASVGDKVLSALGVEKASASYDPNAKPGVVEGYNITDYATDPQHEQKISSIVNQLGPMATSTDIDNYIKSKAPSSPVRGGMVKRAADKYGVPPQMIVALIQNDSSFGTKGLAVKTRNPGNVGNTDTGATQTFRTYEDGVMAVAKWLDKHRV